MQCIEGDKKKKKEDEEERVRECFPTATSGCATFQGIWMSIIIEVFIWIFGAWHHVRWPSSLEHEQIFAGDALKFMFVCGIIHLSFTFYFS